MSRAMIARANVVFKILLNSIPLGVRVSEMNLAMEMSVNISERKENPTLALSHL